MSISWRNKFLLAAGAVLLVPTGVKALPISQDKQVRASGFSSQLNAGNVKLLAATWNSGLIQRLDAFPTKGIPDDEVDALSDAFKELTDTKELLIGVGEDTEKIDRGRVP